MKTFDVVPLVGIGTVLLGTTRSAVHGAMGKPESSFRKTEWSRHVTDTWFGSGFQVFYGGEEPTVNFIELCRGSEFKVLLFGEEVFSKDVPEIVRHVEKFAASDPNNPEHGSSFIFPSIEL
ncbi:MAG TPA: hypothetical protein PLW86_17385, partial [Rhodocyclaceae bacterium]|nr:hypothetical protein [Rhodocyclaceae bacterium]